LGHLVLVKLLIETYHCDDSIVAPDGQTALRLAAENGHREVVDYLPMRRLGGFRRWRHAHRKALRRAVKAASGIYEFLKFFVWSVPKFFLWDIPKNTIVKPISKCCAWCWKRRKEVGPWCKQQILKLPGRAARFGKGFAQFGKGVGRGLAKMPRACWKFGTKTLPELIKKISTWLWKFVTKTLPELVKEFSIWLWELVSERIPRALGILARWVANLVTSSATAVWNVVLKIVSLLSTAVEAIISFFGRVTLADIWNGFVDVLKAVFVTFPKTLLYWIQAFGKTSFKVLVALFGTVGGLLWFLVYALGWVIIYIPKQLWKIITSFGESFMKVFHELRVWLNPKAR
jgi:hypothetical protein